MNHKVRAKYEEWQRAVRRHEEQLREARRNGMSLVQMQNLSAGTVLALDVAFARYKQAEAEPEHEAADLLDAALRALAKPQPEGHGSIH